MHRFVLVDFKNTLFIPEDGPLLPKKLFRWRNSYNENFFLFPHAKLKCVARNCVVHSITKMSRGLSVHYSFTVCFVYTTTYKQLYWKCQIYSFWYIFFFLHNFAVSHLYSKTRGEIDQEWTALKRSDRDLLDSRRLELKISPSGSPWIDITIPK